MGIQVNPVLTSQEPEMRAPTPTANLPSTESPSSLCIPSLHHLCNIHDVPYTRDLVLQTHTNVTRHHWTLWCVCRITRVYLQWC